MLTMKSLAAEYQSPIKSARCSTHDFMTEWAMDLSAFLTQELAAINEYVWLRVLVNVKQRVMQNAMACRALSENEAIRPSLLTSHRILVNQVYRR